VWYGCRPPTAEVEWEIYFFSFELLGHKDASQEKSNHSEDLEKPEIYPKTVLAYTVEGVPYIRKLYGFFKKTVYTVYTVALMLAGVHLKYSAEIKHMWYLLSSALSVSESILWPFRNKNGYVQGPPPLH
jgi:hypothetical protein